MMTMLISLVLGAILGFLLFHSVRMITYARDPQRITEKRIDEFVRR